MTHNPILERLAEEAHSIWADWTTHMLIKLTSRINLDPFQKDYEIVMRDSTDCLIRWARQIKTPYADLTEAEKDSDRDIARRILHAIGWEPRLGEPPGGVDQVLVWRRVGSFPAEWHKGFRCPYGWVTSGMEPQVSWHPDWLWMPLPPPPEEKA